MSEEGPAPSSAPVERRDDPGIAEAVAHATGHEEIPRAGAWAHYVAGLVPLVVGAAAMVESLGLGFGSPTDPGPGLWPFVTSSVLVAASILLLIFGRGLGEDYESFTGGARVIALGVVSLGVFVILFQRVGFELPSLLVFIFWLRFLGRESWRTTLIVSVGATAVFYVLFIVLLGISALPHIALF